MTTTHVPPAPSTPSSIVAPLPQSPATTKRKRPDTDRSTGTPAGSTPPTYAVPDVIVASTSAASSLAATNKKRQTKHLTEDEKLAQLAKKERQKQEKKEARMVRNRQAAQSSRDRKKREVDTMRRQIQLMERTLRDNGLPIVKESDVFDEGSTGPVDVDEDGVPIELDDNADDPDAPPAQKVKTEDGGVFVRPRSDSIGSSTNTAETSRLQQALEEQQRENTELKSRLTQLETLVRSLGADSKSVIGKLRQGEGPAPALAALASPVLDGYQEPAVNLPAEASPQHKDTFEAFQDPAYIQVSGIRSTASDRGSPPTGSASGNGSGNGGRTGNGHTDGADTIMVGNDGGVIVGNGSEDIGLQGGIDQGVRLVAAERAFDRFDLVDRPSSDFHSHLGLDLDPLAGHVGSPHDASHLSPDSGELDLPQVQGDGDDHDDDSPVWPGPTDFFNLLPAQVPATSYHHSPLAQPSLPAEPTSLPSSVGIPDDALALGHGHQHHHDHAHAAFDPVSYGLLFGLGFDSVAATAPPPSGLGEAGDDGSPAGSGSIGTSGDSDVELELELECLIDYDESGGIGQGPGDLQAQDQGAQARLEYRPTIEV